MKTSDTLLLLIDSLTKAEKKSFSQTALNSDYYDLYLLITNNPGKDSEEIKELYEVEKPQSNFNVQVNYLYTKLLDNLLSLQSSSDIELNLFNSLFKAKILAQKSLFQEALQLYQVVQLKAKELHLEYLLLKALQEELKLLLFLNFPNLTEDELSTKHFEITESLKRARRENESSVLYDLLKYRTLHHDVMRSEEQRDALNDLLLSELSISSSSDRHLKSFESDMLHQLFQSTYLLGVNDYNAALSSLKELIHLFEENTQRWEKNPYYYVVTLESILYNLRAIHEYKSISFFLGKLEEIQSKDKEINALRDIIQTLYTLYPLIDTGQFKEASAYIEQNRAKIEGMLPLLNRDKKAEVILCWSIVLVGLGQFREVKDLLHPIIFQSKHFYYLPIFRAIRLIHLISIYELGILDEYEFEIRAFKRDLNKNKKAYQVEAFILKFLTSKKVYFQKREKQRQAIQPIIEAIRQDIYEKQILNLFDFTKWVESKVWDVSFTQLLENKKDSPLH